MLSQMTCPNIFVVERNVCTVSGTRVVEFDAVFFDMSETWLKRMHGFDVAMSAKLGLDQADDETGGQQVVLRIEQDLGFQLASEVADVLTHARQIRATSHLETESSWVEVIDLPAAIPCVFVSTKSITNVEELDEQDLDAELVANITARARRIGMRLGFDQPWSKDNERGRLLTLKRTFR